MQTGGEKTTITVECYSGHKADERPISFTLDGHKRMVEQIMDRWRGPEFEFFKILADDGKGYLLKYDRGGEWTMERIYHP
jgi:hypothetical protein